MYFFKTTHSISMRWQITAAAVGVAGLVVAKVLLPPPLTREPTEHDIIQDKHAKQWQARYGFALPKPCAYLPHQMELSRQHNIRMQEVNALDAALLHQPSAITAATDVREALRSHLETVFEYENGAVLRCGRILSRYIDAPKQ